MFIIKIKTLFSNTIKSINKSFKRFPVSILVSTALVIMLIITNENSSVLNKVAMDRLRRIDMMIALGIPLSLCFKLIFEKKNTKRAIKLLTYVLGIVFLVFYYFYLLVDFNMVSMTRYIAMSIFLYLAFMYIPWIGNKEYYEKYVIKVIGSFFITVIYSAVLYFGLSAIIFTIDKLFSVQIESKIYYYMFLIVAGIFAPSYFLAKIPQNDEDFSATSYSKALKVLLVYIVIPLITIYTAILYAYFIKIIVTKNWPVGLVSHLVLWYSVVTVGVIFLITPIIKENKIAKYFVKWFPKILIPIIIMMFFSIGMRIKAYGITENRYYVIVLGLWVFGIMIYFSFTKKLKNIIIPISLSIIALVSAFGPLSSYSISKNSQNKRLTSILVRNEMLKDNKIVKSSSLVSSEDKIEISMILDYFNDNHDLDDVKYLPDDFKIDDMEKVFGFSYTYADDVKKDNHFYYDSHGMGSVSKIGDFDYIIDMDNAVENQLKIDGKIKAIYEPKNFTFKITDGENPIYIKRLSDYGKMLHNKQKSLLEKGNPIKPEDLTFTDENDKVKVKFVFNHIGIMENSQTNEFEILDMDIYILVKIK